ncbi:MAG: hypothetical protein K8T20_16195 [Planctomycetes bacterium]|nr:hypothetical protein [Planctomycetota bacterium]
MATNDPGSVRGLLKACEDYLAGSLSIEELQFHVGNTESLTMAVEESAFRRFLGSIENQIELIRFTCDPEKVNESMLPIVKNLKARAHSHLASA